MGTVLLLIWSKAILMDRLRLTDRKWSTYLFVERYVIETIWEEIRSAKEKAQLKFESGYMWFRYYPCDKACREYRPYEKLSQKLQSEPNEHVDFLLILQKGWVRLQKTCVSNGTTSSPMLLELSLISAQMEISSTSPLVVLTAPEDSRFRYYN